MSNRNPHTSRNHWRAPDGKEYPIEDADSGSMVIIQTTAADVACAVKRDPSNCALAQAWKRQADVPVALIGMDKCYLPVRKKGKVVALRFKTTAETRRVIERFDKTGRFPKEALTLRGIPKSERMESQRSQAKRLRKRWSELGKPTAKARPRSLTLRNASPQALGR